MATVLWRPAGVDAWASDNFLAKTADTVSGATLTAALASKTVDS